MHNYPQNDTFIDHNLKLHKMLDMHLKYDNMYTNRIFNALICINNHINSYINCMLSNDHAQICLYIYMFFDDVKHSGVF